MDKYIRNPNLANSLLDYSDWGWYIDIDQMETCKIVPPSPVKIKHDYSINIYDDEIYDTNSELDRIKKLLVTDSNILYEFYKKPTTELFVTVGSFTLINSIMAYIIFFIL
jgi:hypothetical protein